MSAPTSSRNRRLTATRSLLHTSALASAGPLYKSLPFDPIKDFAPVTNVVATQMVVSGLAQSERDDAAAS